MKELIEHYKNNLVEKRFNLLPTKDFKRVKKQYILRTKGISLLFIYFFITLTIYGISTLLGYTFLSFLTCLPLAIFVYSEVFSQEKLNAYLPNIQRDVIYFVHQFANNLSKTEKDMLMKDIKYYEKNVGNSYCKQLEELFFDYYEPKERIKTKKITIN